MTAECGHVWLARAAPARDVVHLSLRLQLRECVTDSSQNEETTQEQVGTGDSHNDTAIGLAASAARIACRPDSEIHPKDGAAPTAAVSHDSDQSRRSAAEEALLRALH